MCPVSMGCGGTRGCDGLVPPPHAPAPQPVPRPIARLTAPSRAKAVLDVLHAHADVVALCLAGHAHKVSARPLLRSSLPPPPSPPNSRSRAAQTRPSSSSASQLPPAPAARRAPTRCAAGRVLPRRGGHLPSRGRGDRRVRAGRGRIRHCAHLSGQSAGRGQRQGRVRHTLRRRRGHGRGRGRGRGDGRRCGAGALRAGTVER
jgi:hypothetical protein